jgi:geranylgeranyl diphosphate synthase, type II
MNDLQAWLKLQQNAVDQALAVNLPDEDVCPQDLHKAMHYSVFAGGKRLRPILCIAAAEACGAKGEQALLPACALEVLHTYSLIHDDLPCMDDDDLRRGIPTNHKVFGEAMAVLAGDALLSEAFIILCKTPPTQRYSVGDYVAELANASGSKNLIGGQVLDLQSEGKVVSKEQLIQIHESKTAALLIASIKLGGMVANADPQKLEMLAVFAYHIGLAFQIVDDILDVTQSTETLGKTAGKDEASAKSTYPAILGLEESKNEAIRLTNQALPHLLSSVIKHIAFSRLLATCWSVNFKPV